MTKPNRSQKNGKRLFQSDIDSTQNLHIYNGKEVVIEAEVGNLVVHMKVFFVYRFHIANNFIDLLLS